ncbi:hypothetical protein PEC311524_35870 [Pectobacterium carotovorum subsp. carotovorum]|nr:hypothetical protein PEC311524_35870 [Pectobacterium carotovorum subsp. carotovorum]
MAYDPQQQRPEQQVTNTNRQTLNIQQPDEPVNSSFDWGAVQIAREKAGRQSQRKPPSLGENVTDAGRAIWSGIDSAALNVREAISKIPGIGEPIVSGIDAADRYIFGHEDSEQFLKQDQQQTIANMTPQMQEALKAKWWDSERSTLGPAWTDWRSYAGGGLQSLPEMVLTMAPAMRAAKWSYTSKIAAGASAQEAGIAAARIASITGKITEGILGGAASSREVRDTIKSLPDGLLLQSETAQALIQSGMSIEETKNVLAEDASTKAFLMAGTATGVFGGQGDKVIAKILTGQITKGVLPRFIKGAVAEGVMEELPQSVGSRLAENYAIQTANPTHSISDDVLNQGLSGVAIGGVMGGTIAAGSRSNKWSGDPQQGDNEANQNTDTSPAAEPPALAPVQPQLSPYEEATQRYATMDRAAVLREYANADLSNNADAKHAANERLAGIDREDSVNQFADKYQQQSDDELLVAYRGLNENTKRSDEEQIQYEAARSVLSQRLGVNQPQATQVDVPEWQSSEQQPSPDGNGSSIPVVKMGDDSAPPGYTGEWRDGEPVISVTQGADNPQFNPENVAGTPQSRVDEFRDTPAYLRQEPRIQGFAEDSDVQQALAEQQDSPTAEQLIRQQIEQGDQGYSPQELEALEQAERIIAARRPRLPAPGQTSVIAMPGEVRQPAGDDSQAGTGPQFDAGQQVRGQEFIPAERSPAMNEVGRANQTYDGEAVPSNVIEDKNIIFSGSPTIDEGQTAQPPQFTEGETRTQRQTRQFSDAMGVNDQAALPDQRQRVGNVPIDAQTEAYARGEPVGQLKFYYKDRPFPSEYLAERSKWGKMPGATVEKVDGGYAVRLPASEQSKPYYSRQVNRPDGLTVPETQRIADDFVREYNGNIPVDIRVYARQEDAYGPRATQENEGRIPGAYHAAGKGRIVLNAASIRNAADGRTTLRHEVLGHYGLNTFKSADKRLVIDAIIKTRKDPKYRSLWE